MPLAYEIVGRGAPLVLVHAFPLSSWMWRAERRRFGGAWRVLTPDLPGFGRSPRLPQPSIGGFAEAVWETVDQLALPERPVLGGLSMGGYVVFEMLRRRPDRIAGLLLMSTRATPDTPEQRAGRMTTIDRIRRDGVTALREVSLPKLLGAATQATRPDLVREVEAQLLRASADGVCDALLAMAERPDASPLLQTIACPTLVVAGEEDALIPAEYAEAMARQIPGAAPARLARAGHLLNLEQPAAAQAAMDRLLQPLRTPPAS